MSYNPNSTRKRPREDDEEEDSELLRRRCPPQQRFQNVSTHDHARQHNGDQYHGNVTIYHGAAVPASASRSPEPTAIETALESLMFEEMDARYLTIDASLTPSSCRWLLEREEYKKWQDVGCLSEHHGFLWIKGKAGAGKSTLMKFAFNNAEKTRCENQTIVSFFFNARGAPIERSLTGMYRALLYQILHKIPRLRHLLCKKRTLSAQSQDWSLSLLRTVFQDVIENLASEHLICYVDALDECTKDDVKEMVSLFEDLGEFSVARGTKFSVCFASRHYPHITIEQSESITLEDQDGHKADIFAYIKKKLKMSNKALKGEVSKQIEDRASGVFLWVVLVVGILNDECSRGNVQMIRARLKEIPSGLTDLIQDILDRDKPTKHLVPLLQWVLFSRRPLSPEELFLALQSIESETIQDSHTPEALARDNIDKFILNTSKGLAEMTKGKKPKVQFIHELVRTHFLGPEGLAKLDPHLQTHLVGQSHDQLKTCCYNYLLSGPCNHMTFSTVPAKAESQYGKSMRSETLRALPFVQYALENILYHTNLAHLNSIQQLGFLESFPWVTWVKLDNAAARFTSFRHATSICQAYILAEQGCAALLAIAMESLPRPDEPEERHQSILGAAVDARDIKSVLVVLSHEGYENSLGKDKALCMTLAIENDEFEIVQALIEAKAKPYKVKVSAIEYYAATKNNAMALAASHPDKFNSSLGRFGLLRLMLSNLSDEDKSHQSCINALGYMMSELCKSGNLEECNSLYRGISPIATPQMLCEASRSGNLQLVQSILKNGIGINEQGILNRFTANALSVASQAGHEDVVRFLLREGAAWKVLPDALEAASEAGHEHVARILLREGLDLERKINALIAASSTGKVTIMRILLENGVDLATPGLDGHQLLRAACLNGRLAAARLLIENGARVDSRTVRQETPIYTACIRGHGDIVQMLLEYNANIDLPDYCGISPLSRATINGHPEIACLLVEHGADIHQTSSRGETALLWATVYNRETVARLLISKGASVNVRDNYGRTALSVARNNGNPNIGRLLIENGAVE